VQGRGRPCTTPESHMLLQTYDLEVFTMACDCHASSLGVFAHLHQDAGEALPYLNAIWPGAVYDHAAQVLTCKVEGHEVSLRPHLIAMSDVADRHDAARRVEEMVALINRTWQRRDEIAPTTRKRQRPPAMALYRLLPGGNCKACGESTCFNFAAKLSGGQAALTSCAPLLEEALAGRRASLQALLAAAL
jgi:ArsR family metal-binding transcriptional regulator